MLAHFGVVVCCNVVHCSAFCCSVVYSVVGVVWCMLVMCVYCDGLWIIVVCVFHVFTVK